MRSHNAVSFLFLQGTLGHVLECSSFRRRRYSTSVSNERTSLNQSLVSFVAQGVGAYLRLGAAACTGIEYYKAHCIGLDKNAREDGISETLIKNFLGEHSPQTHPWGAFQSFRSWGRREEM